ncbi:MAG: hypothetical protein BMS9Abin05_2520 [Rhodothermia bacterium]|nr:MAG: hypothetical protein BMS9Abin05_2520 [Rhodothermia bacterium]
MTVPNNLFQNQPDNALLWIYTSDRTISVADQDRLLASVRNFIASWTSHERPVTAEVEILLDRFLIVSAYIPGGNVSGCGIDKLVHAMVVIRSGFEFEWLDRLQVPYKSETEGIVSVDRSAFRTMVNDGTITGETLVYDTSLHTLGDLRAVGLERTAGNSWHARVFSLGASVST